MQTKKNMVSPNVTIPLPEGVTWTELVTLIKQEKNQKFLKKISPETFKYILDEENHSQVIKSLLKILKQTDPKNATKEYAEVLIEVMKKVKNITLRQSKI
jgi:DNA topoisomerase VI subunit B